MKSVRNRFNHVFVISLLLVLSMLIIPFTSVSVSVAQEEQEELKINAMTYNLYLGADIFKVVEAAQTNPELVPYVVAEVYQTMLYTNFSARAEAIADEIAANKPQVVGLQEVETFYKQTPGDFMSGNPTPAEDVVIDFYAVLDAALKARGMYYDAYNVTNADVEMPMIDEESPTFLSDVRMVDHDVILVRKGHAASPVLADNYAINVGIDMAGTYVEFTRGYVVVDVDVKGQVFRFVSTHLEVRSDVGSVFRFVQSAQMQELILTLAGISSLDPKPIVMVGDFNSDSEDVPGCYETPIGCLPYIPPYMQAVNAGYLDAWLEQSKYDEGFTSGFDEYVSDPTAVLDTRIDLVFVDPEGLLVDKVSCDVVGDEVSDMVPNPVGGSLWPSDHASVVAKLKFSGG
jgi:endonuclease/exonuclease/phosphatase family metal-dependent hydrolase